MTRRGGRSTSYLGDAFRFAQWAMQLPKPPTRLEVMEFLQCSGPRAKQWRKTWLQTLPAKVISPAGGNRSGNPDTLSENTDP